MLNLLQLKPTEDLSGLLLSINRKRNGRKLILLVGRTYVLSVKVRASEHAKRRFKIDSTYIVRNGRPPGFNTEKKRTDKKFVINYAPSRKQRNISDGAEVGT